MTSRGPSVSVEITPALVAFARRTALHCARSYTWADDADVESAGMVGLLSASRRFRPDAGCAFEAFARHRIRGAVLDALREDHTIRPAATTRRKMQRVRMDDVADLAEDLAADCDSPEERAAVAGLVRRMHERLTAHEADLFSRLLAGGTSADVARELGVTQGLMCQRLRYVRQAYREVVAA